MRACNSPLHTAPYIFAHAATHFAAHTATHLAIPLQLAIKKRTGTPEEVRQAERILPLVTKHHFLLVTLLIFNSLANEASS